MNCPYCINKKSRKTKTSPNSNTLSLNDIKKIIKETSINSSFLYIVGGEPLFFKEINEVFSYLKENNICVSLTTNGLLLERYASEIIETLSFISISLDGGNANVHDTLRGSLGSFDKTINGIKELIKKRGNNILPIIKIVTVITKSNIKNLIEIYNLCKELRVDEWQISHNCFYDQDVINNNNTFIKTYKSGKNIEGQFIDTNSYLSNEEITLLINEINKIFKLSETSSLNVTPYPILKDDDFYPYYQGKIPKNINSLCNDPFSRLNVRGNGDVELCQGVIVGNIYENNLRECWLSKEADDFRKLIRDNKFTPACHRCCELKFNF
ncbi:MAG: radical SAM protein [Nitrospirae bacterium]|nr:radical SAM protein [Nitrospirota bacterium]